MIGELVIRGATVLDPEMPLRTADILVIDGRIAEVGHVTAAATTNTIDGAGLVAMPGLVNAHTHSGQHLDRGIAPSLPLDLWLMWVVYAGVEFSPDDSYTLALSGALEMTRTGCTAVLDHPWVPVDGFDQHIEALAAAYADAGMRCGLAPMIQDRDIFESIGFGDAPAPPALSEPVAAHRLIEAMEQFLHRYAGRRLLTPMVGPSAPQRCSDELMVGLAELARTHAAPLHTHVLETRSQVFATRERYGTSVLDYLDSIGGLNERTSLAHCVWLDADEYELVRSTGSTIVHNPISNLRCGSGILPLSGLLHGGVSVGLGADGAASNDNQNMFEAMKVAALLHTLASPFQQWPTATQIWSAGLRGGARALHAEIGSLTPGRRADIVLLDTERHVAADHDALVRSLVFAEHGESVHTVIVDGDVVIEDGTRTRTPDGHRARERELLQRIHASLPGREALLARYGPALTAVHHRDEATPLTIRRMPAITPAFATTTTNKNTATNPPDAERWST
jgi:cytosine/adenosine deaminase-related metal-dependent hydrolase